MALMWRFLGGFAGFAEATSRMPSSELSSGNTGGVPPEFDGMMTSMAATQPLSLVSWACIIILAIWFFRAATAAAHLGIPARRTPGWATASWFIPVVNFWWPCQSARDLLPSGHEMRPRITVLWVASIVAILLTSIGWVAALVHVMTDTMRTVGETTGGVVPSWPSVPVGIQALAVVGLLVEAGVLIAARGVVAAVLAEHQRLVDQRAARSATV